MLRNIPLILLVSASLVACGGSDNKKKNNSSSSAPASSAPASVAPSSTPASVAPSSTPASAAPSSTPTSSAPAAPTVINADMTTGWRGNNEGLVAYSTDGVTLTGTADGQGAVFDILAPTQLEGAVVEMVVNVSNEYKTSGADLQIFAQVKTGSYPGEYGCYTGNVDLTSGTDQTLTCTIDEGTLFNQTANDVQVGIQVKSTTAIAGTVIIKSVKVTLATPGASSSTPSSVSSASSSAPSQASGTYTPTSLDGWYVNGGGSPNQMQLELNAATGSGLNMVPIDWAENASANYKYETRFTLPAPQNIEAGDVITYTVVVPQSYIDDATAVLQINWHNVAGGGSKYGGAAGGYRTLSAAGGVTAGVDLVITETVVSADALANTDTLGLQISKAPSNTNIKDKILIKSVSVQ